MRRCPLCGSGEFRPIGPIVHRRPTLVAGVPLDLPERSYRLVHCMHCAFRFKDPPIPQDLLLDCYARSEKGNWGEIVDPSQRRFDAIEDMIRRAPGRRVLDVGCFNGSLLQYLGTSWQRFGVEPSRDAAALASERGVEVLGATLDDLPKDMEKFDAIVVVDVAEHIPHPLPFFLRIHDLLRPDGVLLLVTADYDSWNWSVEGSRYWYCSIPEHVSFYSRRVLEFVGRDIGFQMVEYRRLSHARDPFTYRWKERIKNAVFISARTLGGLGIGPFRRWLDNRPAPTWVSAKDHMFALLRRDS